VNFYLIHQTLSTENAIKIGKQHLVGEIVKITTGSQRGDQLVDYFGSESLPQRVTVLENIREVMKNGTRNFLCVYNIVKLLELEFTSWITFMEFWFPTKHAQKVFLAHNRVVSVKRHYQTKLAQYFGTTQVINYSIE
jgi:hypothetical protein